MYNKFICIMQDSKNDCGSASLLTVLKTIGVNTTKEELKKLTKTSAIGTSALNLINASKKLGIKSYGIKSTIDDLTVKLPVIAHVVKDNYYHFLVIHEINPIKKYLIIADPSIGISKITFDYFNKITTNVFIAFEYNKKKPIKDNRLFLFFYRCIEKNKSLFIKVIILSIFSIIFTVLLSIYLKLVITVPKIIAITILFLVIALLKSIMDFIRNKALITLELSIEQQMTYKTYNHILLLPYDYYQKRTMGEFLSIINDITSFKEVICQLLISSCIDGLLIITIAIFLAFYNYICLIFISLLFLIYLIIYKLAINKFYTIFIKLKAKSIKISNYFVEMLMGFQTIKNLNIFTYINNKLKDNYNEYEIKLKDYNKKYINLNYIKGLSSDIFQIIIIFVSFYFYKLGYLSISDIVLFNSLFGIIITSSNNIIDSFINMVNNKININRVLDLYEVSEEDIISKTNMKIKTIAYRDIRLVYEKKVIFNNLNFIIKNQDKIFIYGESGIGKSSLVKILLGNVFTFKGRIIYNNSDTIPTISDIRENIIYVSQDETLFNTSIKENICLGDYNKEKLDNLCQMLNISNYDQEINDDGSNLSGGERKKIILARALYKERNIYIFDETFNEISIIEEKIILEKILKYYSNKIIIVISHRLNNKNLFKRVIEIKKGGVINERIN